MNRNIFFVVSSLNVGGAEKILCDLAFGLRVKGYNPVIVCLKNPGFWGSHLVQNQVTFYDLGLKNRWDLMNISKLWHLIKRHKPRVICSLDHRDAIFWSRLLSAFFQHPHLLWQHSLRIAGAEAQNRRLLEIMIKATTPLSKRIIACSNAVKHVLVSQGIAEKKIQVIPNGVFVADQPEPHLHSMKRYWKQQFNIPQAHKIVGMVAALRPAKAHEVFLNAARAILDQRPSTSFLAVGEGYRRDELVSRAASLGIENQVIFPGNITPAADVMRVFDVGVLSSNHEAMPMVILEYMAIGLPVVSTESGGPSEIIKHGQTGFLVPVKDAQSMADSVLRLLNDNDLAFQMGATGRLHVQTHFSLERMVQRYIQLFETLDKCSLTDKKSFHWNN